jgi:hypothetical protein
MNLSWLLPPSGGSRGPPVVVVQAPKDRNRHDLSFRSRAVHRLGGWDPLLQSLMRPSPIEVRDVLAEHDVQVALSEDDDVVEALASNAPQESLAGRVHQGSPHSRLQESDSGRPGHAIEAHPELRIPIAEEELGPYSAKTSSLRRVGVRRARISCASSPQQDRGIDGRTADTPTSHLLQPLAVDR